MKRVPELFLMSVLSIAAARAQVPVHRIQMDRIASAAVSYESWKSKGDKITEFSLPVTLIYPAGGKLCFYALTAPAVSSNLDAGGEYALKGMSDLKWGGHWLFPGNHGLLTFGMNLPTGKSSMKTEEYPVASALSMAAFNFRVPTLGQGFDVQIGINAAHEWGGFVVGYGAGYLRKGGFEPFTDLNQTYKPGDEMSVTLGAEKETALLGRSMTITGDAVYSMYSKDTWDGENAFQSGNRLLIQFASAFRLEPVDVTVFIRERIKAKNRTGSGRLFDTERRNTNGNQFEVLGVGDYPFSKDVRLRGSTEIKLYSANDYGVGGAALFGLGAGAWKRLSPGAVVSAEFRYYFGSIKTTAEKTDASGMKILGGIEYTL